MKQHRFDTLSFIFGTVFTLLGLVFIIAASPWELLVVDFQWGWLGPVLLIGLGVLILVPMLRRRDESATHPGVAPGDAGESIVGDMTDQADDLEAARAELPPDPLS